MPEPIGPTPAERAKAYAANRFLDTVGNRHGPILVDVDGNMQVVVEHHLITFKILSAEPLDGA